MEHLLHNVSGPVDRAALDAASGVGVTVTPEEIEAGVERVVTRHRAELLEKRYRFNTGVLVGTCCVVGVSTTFSWVR